jgi:acetyltransferase
LASDVVSTARPQALNAGRSLARFFNPRSVAFVGATDDQSKFGGRCLSGLLEFGYEGHVLPVNPKRTKLFDRPCYPSVQDLPEVPDHVGIALPVAPALDALEHCARMGVPFATVFSAGFLETGTAEGRAMQERLRAICRDSGIRVMGPNCNGVVSYVDRFALTSTFAVRGPRRPAGDLGIASQSGGAGQINTMWRAMQAGLGISYQVSSGNDADLDLLDYMDFMLDSAQTNVVLAIAERISNGQRLKELALKSAKLDKPILMIKVGRSKAGSAAAASHTGAITGADDVADAALAQWGIVRVDDTNDLIEFAKLFRRKRRPAGRRVSATSVSGGNLVLAVDIASASGLEWPAFGPAAMKGLGELLPDYGKPSNPLDLTAAAVGVEDMLVRAGTQILADDGIDTFVTVITMARRSEIESVADFTLTAPKQPVLLWTGGCVDDPSLSMPDLVRLGVPVFDDAARCFRAIAASASHAQRQARMLRETQDFDDTQAPSPAPAGLSILNRGVLTERASKELLATFGLPVTLEELATTADQAVEIAGRIAGPAAMKIESPDIAHKTEAGAIRLGVAGESAVRAAFAEVMSAARSYSPTAELRGVLVQEMVGPGVELLLGSVNDPIFGQVVMVGAGGIHVEVFRDVARRVAPVSEAAAREMLESLRIWPILAGTRGHAGYDIESVVNAIVSLSRLVMHYGSAISEIDLNPLIVQPRGRGACVVDALVVSRAPSAPQEAASIQ